MAKDKAIMFRVTEQDKREIEDQARVLGLSISSYFLMLHKKNTTNWNKEGGKTMTNLNTAPSVPNKAGFHKLIEIPVENGSTIQKMAELLKSDLTFQDSFMEIIDQNEETVEDWLSKSIKDGWATIDQGNLIIWVEYF